MFCVYTEIMAQNDTVTFEKFSFYRCLRLTSPNYAFMRYRLYNNQKVKLYSDEMLHHAAFHQDYALCVGDNGSESSIKPI